MYERLPPLPPMPACLAVRDPCRWTSRVARRRQSTTAAVAASRRRRVSPSPGLAWRQGGGTITQPFAIGSQRARQNEFRRVVRQVVDRDRGRRSAREIVRRSGAGRISGGGPSRRQARGDAPATPRVKRWGSRISSRLENELEWPLCGVADRNSRCSNRPARSRTALVNWLSTA